MSTPAEVQVAVEAFRLVERRKLALDKAEKELSAAVVNMAVNCDESAQEEYYTLTTSILEEYNDKRERAKL